MGVAVKPVDTSQGVDLAVDVAFAFRCHEGG